MRRLVEFRTTTRVTRRYLLTLPDHVTEADLFFATPTEWERWVTSNPTTELLSHQESEEEIEQKSFREVRD